MLKVLILYNSVLNRGTGKQFCQGVNFLKRTFFKKKGFTELFLQNFHFALRTFSTKKSRDNQKKVIAFSQCPKSLFFSRSLGGD